MNIMEVRKTMKIGVVGAFYPVPPEIDEDHETEWLIKRSAEMGCKCLHLSTKFNEDDDSLKRLRELTETYDVELDMPAPRELFTFIGADAAEARKALISRISSMQKLNTKIMRSGYGGLNIETSRFNKNFPLKEHMAFVANNLKEVAKVLEEYGMYLAIENHCDFKGTEMAEIFDMVDSPNVGCALDTANGYTVFCDPDDDVKVLAPYTFTTHLKDMLMLKDPIGPRIPFYPVGCAVGEGHVNIPAAIDTLVEKCPHANGLHLIIEIGWQSPAADWDKAQKDAYVADMFHKSIDYLKKIL